jgi:hypothetical protein
MRRIIPYIQLCCIMKEEKLSETQVRQTATRKEREPRKPRCGNILLESKENVGGTNEGPRKLGEQLG